MREETVQYVVRELGKHRPEDDIIRVVISLEDVSWEGAKRIVAGIKVKYRGQIARRQGPFFVAVGIATAVFGLILTAMMVVATINGFSIFFLTLPIPFLGNIVYGVIGLGMMAGGAYGLGPVLWEFVTAKDQEE
jgi:hypothetical protein